MLATCGSYIYWANFSNGMADDGTDDGTSDGQHAPADISLPRDTTRGGMSGRL